MISIEEFMNAVNYRITEGSEYLWGCFGNQPYRIESESDEFTISLVFNPETLFVFEMEVWDYVNQRAYRWVSPQFIKSLKKESKNRGLKFKGEGTYKFIDLDVPADILEKATAIANGEEYDERVMIELNMTDEEMALMARAAHIKDVTINQFVVDALEEAIKESKK